MRRAVRLAAGAAAAGVVALLLGRVPDLLAKVELFRVDAIEVEEARYVTEKDIRDALALGPDASVWDDPESWEEGLAGHPMVLGAEIGRKLPSTLVVRLEERVPVGLVEGPPLEPVDAEGRTLPLDPTRHRLDLPLLRIPEGRVDRARSHDEGAEEDGDSVTASIRRTLATEAARLTELAPDFAAALSEMVWLGEGEVWASWGADEMGLRYPAPLSPRRLREVRAVLTDAGERWPGRRVELLDLRFDGQIVLRHAEGG